MVPSGPTQTVAAHLRNAPLTQPQLDQLSQWILDKDLRALTFPDPVWAVPGLLREGLALLVSAPKLGKSWLALQLAYAVATGGQWIGRQLGDPAWVLNVMGEDTLETLQERCLKLIPAGLDDANIPLVHSTSWKGDNFVERLMYLDRSLREAIEANRPFKLVIIDTLELFRGPGDPKKNAYRDEVATLKLLRSMALEHHCVILFLHHTNKIATAWDEGGDPFQAISGSMGLAGTANTIMMIQRARGETSGVLHVGGHRVKDQKIALKFEVEAGVWTVDGVTDPETAVLSGAPRAIMEHLLGHPSSLECLADNLPAFGKEAIKKALNRLHKEGKVVNIHGLWERVATRKRRNVSEHERVPAATPLIPTQREQDAPPAVAPADPAEPTHGVPASDAPGTNGQAVQQAPDSGGTAAVYDTRRVASTRNPGTLALDVSDLNPKRAIAASMALMKGSIQRDGTRYHPSLFATQPDHIPNVWEGRHKFDLTKNLEPGIPLVRLDKNAAYLSAANTALPIGALQHDPDPVGAGAGRAGTHLVNYTGTIGYPCGSPLGNREEAGEIWITTPTLKLLNQIHATMKIPLVDVIDSWTAPSTEVLLRPWINELRDQRAEALRTGNTELYEFVKFCYSKAIATMGESNANWEIRRPDWMKIIRSQAYANLYRTAFYAMQGWPIYPIIHLGNIDEMWLIDTSQDYPVELGSQLGQWKIKRQWTHGDPE